MARNQAFLAAEQARRHVRHGSVQLSDTTDVHSKPLQRLAREVASPRDLDSLAADSHLPRAFLTTVRIIDLNPTDQRLIDALAELSVAASQVHLPAWLTNLEDAHEEIGDALNPDKVVRVLMDGDEPAGWVAAGPMWGRVWELHPLLVDPRRHRRGLGTRLVRDIERFATAAGALTMYLGTSDMTRATSLSGIDLYDDPISAMASFQVLDTHGHPASFWLRAGYSLVGVTPDAEAEGQPSLQFARSLRAGRGPETEK